jgi:hypothetical protein
MSIVRRLLSSFAAMPERPERLDKIRATRRGRPMYEPGPDVHVDGARPSSLSKEPFSVRTSASAGGDARLRRLRPACLTILATAGALAVLPAAAQAADLHATTASFSSVYASAKGGDTVYLAAGNYGSFAGSSKTSLVTIKPESGAAATMSINFNGATNVRVDGLTISGATVQGTTKNVAIANSRFTGPTVVRTNQMANANVVFDGNTYADLNPSGDYEGRITLPGDGPSTSGVVIENSLFTGGLSDGIQNGSNGTKILNNEFSDIHQGDPDIAHTDALQLYGSSNTVVSGNYFHDVEDCIMAPDGTDHETITDNVCVTSGDQYGFTIGTDKGSIIDHNTLAETGLRLYPGNANRASTGTVVTNNILPGGDVIQGTGLAVDSNLSASTTAGAHAIKGTPTFAGGSRPTTLDGYALAPTSVGKGTASDGSDRGADPADDGTTAPPPVAPTPPADTTAPNTTITTGPTGTITVATASFAFTASESGSTFQCRLDTGGWAACTSPKSYTGLGAGGHTVAIRATDLAGNVDATPASRAFTVGTAPAPDTTAPDTTITSGPTGTITATSGAFAFTSSESGSSFQCRLDTGGWAACTSPKSYTGLSAGGHTVAVRATDGAGNVDASPASRTFTIATAPPAEPTAPVTTSTPPATTTPTPPATTTSTPPATTTSTPPATTPPATPEPPATTAPSGHHHAPTHHHGRGGDVDLRAPKKVTVHNSHFRLACGTSCTVRVTSKNRKNVALGRGTGDRITLTRSGRKALLKAGRKGVSATVRAVAGGMSYVSTSKLLLGR